jgi:hypothetical protein
LITDRHWRDRDRSDVVGSGGGRDIPHRAGEDTRKFTYGPAVPRPQSQRISDGDTGGFAADRSVQRSRGGLVWLATSPAINLGRLRSSSEGGTRRSRTRT